MRIFLIAVVAATSQARGPAHPLFPRPEETTAPRLSAWEPSAEDTSKCDTARRPKECLHFRRRGWCVKQVEANEAEFGETWTFNEKEGRDGRTDHLFCQQYRSYDLLACARGRTARARAGASVKAAADALEYVTSREASTRNPVRLSINSQAGDPPVCPAPFIADDRKGSPRSLVTSVV